MPTATLWFSLPGAKPIRCRREWLPPRPVPAACVMVSWGKGQEAEKGWMFGNPCKDVC